MIKRMIVMLVAVALIFGGIFGFQAYKAHMIDKATATRKPPPVTVTAMKAQTEPWQPKLEAIGSLRAVQGVDVTSEIAGLVQTVSFQSGDQVQAGQLLIQLNADADIAQLHALEAAANLAETIYQRDKKQFAIQAVSQATLDADASDLKGKKALAAQQAAMVIKKTIRAPFAGKLGIATVNPGQYINPGDKIVTLQNLDSLYVDFYLPQKDLARITPDQEVSALVDTFPGRIFSGRITAIDAKVDPATRNALIEATIENPKHKLLPGMFTTIEVKAGTVEHYLTLPQTAVTYNPYGDTVYIIEKGSNSGQSKPQLTARQVFVTLGLTRGDQVAILKGVREDDMVVTSGQLKLKNGSQVIVNNKIQPSNEAAPLPQDE